MQQPTISTQARTVARLLLYLASVLLIAELLRLRAVRVADTQTPFFTLQFIALLTGALLLALGSLFLVHQDAVHRRLGQITRPRRLLVFLPFLVLSFALLIAAGSLLAFLQPYLFPFAAWLLLANLALLALLLMPDPQTTSPDAAADNRPASAPGLLSKIILMAVVGVIVPLLLLELGLRFWVMNFGTEQDRVAYVYSADEISARTLRFRGLPYVNYGLSPDYPGHNSLGYRGPEIQIPKPDGTFRIVALGGSTTYGILLDDWREAYPAQLEQVLRDTYGYEQVEVINSGVPAYTTWETLVNFEFRVLDLQPDLVIVYHAINDLGARAMPSESYRGIPGNAGIWQLEALNLGPSTLYRYLAVNLGTMTNPNNIRSLLRAYEQAGRECCENLSDEETAARFRANPPIYFERNLRSLVAAAQAHEVEVVMSSWAYFPDETPNGENLLAQPYRQEAIAEHNAATQRVAEAAGVAFYDLYTHMPYNRDFWFGDGMHMTASGAHEQARQYAAFLDSEGLIPPD